MCVDARFGFLCSYASLYDHFCAGHAKLERMLQVKVGPTLANQGLLFGRDVWTASSANTVG